MFALFSKLKNSSLVKSKTYDGLVSGMSSISSTASSEDVQPIIVLTNLPNTTGLPEKVSEIVIANNAAACVNILKPVKSIYKWKGEVITDEEIPLLIKSVSSKYSLIEQLILQNHPYEVPEIISMNITNGFDKYLSWISAETKNL